MKAISLWQPWATLWLLEGEKVFETRHWYASHRGPLLVHAAKKKDRETVDAVYNDGPIFAALVRHGIHGIENLAFGAIIGQIDMIGCSLMSRMPPPSEHERAFGYWEPERYAWERAASPIIFPEPIPYKGSQGFFDVPASALPFDPAHPKTAKSIP